MVVMRRAAGDRKEREERGVEVVLIKRSRVEEGIEMEKWRCGR